VAVGALGLATSLVFWLAMLNSYFNGDYEDAFDDSGDLVTHGPTVAHWLAASLTLVAVIALGLVWYARRESARLAFIERVEAEKRDALRAAQDARAPANEQDIVALVNANRALLDEYQAPVRRQARTSYTYSQIAIFAGLTALLIGVAVVLATNDLSARLATAGLSAIGTVLAGYIARTYLRVYERAQDQLNFYFREPLVTSYLLTAERLAEKLEGDRRQDAYSGMVAEIVRAAGSDMNPGGASTEGSPSAGTTA
jgi:hypothetical protein